MRLILPGMIFGDYSPPVGIDTARIKRGDHFWFQAFRFHPDKPAPYLADGDYLINAVVFDDEAHQLVLSLTALS